MAKITGIEWADATHNFWYGCRKVSQGCRLCYAEREMVRYGRDFGTVVRAKGFNKPLSWKEPLRIFVNSWSDFFIEEADQWRDEAWEIIKQTPQHTYLILTKRPERIRQWLPKPLPRNVWWGVSIESQKYIYRWDELCNQLQGLLPTVLFVSAEPLLGPLDFSYYSCGFMPDWIIIGGESGPGHRVMSLEWVRSLIAQCKEKEVACFVKQLGGWPDKCSDFEFFADDLRVREFPVEHW